MANAKRLPQSIALFTDFGEAGPYTGQVEAVLLASAADVPVVRLLSDAPLCNPRASAYLLSALVKYQPRNTLFVSVVDPGVGGGRLPLLVQTESHWFVGPDNGLFSQIVRDCPAAVVGAIEWRPDKLSASFHGRDLFAPVAAACARGEEIDLLPQNPIDLVGADWPNDLMEIIYIDHYGNAFSGARGDAFGDDVLIQVEGVDIGYARTFSDKDPGQPFWYRNSIGLVEIAVNQGRADQLLELEIGQPLLVN
ncbi:MAG: SAM-dependent chlorinase/fluorinase [Gammaproteobacteria bacterium]|nr:SAM-dependent chlorinase/fluorinase [Gammaproteobacteria bacterium]